MNDLREFHPEFSIPQIAYPDPQLASSMTSLIRAFERALNVLPHFTVASTALAVRARS